MDSTAPADGEGIGVVDSLHPTQLIAGRRMSIQRLHTEPGTTIPEHSHRNERAGYIARGTFTGLVEGTRHQSR